MIAALIYNTPTLLVVIVLFFLIYFFTWLGNRIKKITRGDIEGVGPVEGALLGLLALLLSFTFSASYSKYDERRKMIVQEANDIGTAILRIDMYPDSLQALLKADFKSYVGARIAYYKAGTNEKAIAEALNETESFSNIIWKRITAASRQTGSLVYSAQMIPAVNNMIDDVTTREELRLAKVPASIKWVLLLLILSCSLIIGLNAQNIFERKFINIGFTIMICLTCYLILDLDKPRMGLINMDKTEKKIEELQNLLN